MANLTNSAKLIQEMAKKANRTELPEVNNSTVNFTVNGNTGSQSMTTNQASNSTVNLTVDKTTVGLGNVDNTSDANKPISTATQAALDLKADKSDLSSVYKYKGSVASYSNLPSTGLTAGDVYNVEDTGMNYAWTGSAWDQLGATVDLSNYVDKSTNQTIGGTKTFSNEPVLPSKSTAAGNNATKPATEAQVYLKANDADVVKISGNQTIAGTKTFSTSPVVPSKTTAASNTGTAIATEAQVYKKQDKLTTQTAYSAKGTATKVPQITTNNLGQVTGITEIDIQAGETYNAGEGIEIGDIRDYSAMQGPAPDGFHVPLNTEWQAVYDVRTALGGGSTDGTNFGIALKLPFAGFRYNSSSNTANQGVDARCWSTTSYGDRSARSIVIKESTLNVNNGEIRGYGYSIRHFKDSPIIPTSSWIKLYGTSIEAGGIFWSSVDGLISLSSDGTTWITIADKNLGATTVWNSGDTLSEANCGYYYQWGNNYGFPRTGTISDTSSTQVDASNYGPGNYYNSSTFIYRDSSPYGWDSSNNTNLWGGDTGVITIQNAITNTGVLSVNGQTGNVTISSGAQIVYVTQDEYDALPSSKESDGVNYYIYRNSGVTLKSYEEIVAMATAETSTFASALAELNSHPSEYYNKLSSEGYMTTGDGISVSKNDTINPHRFGSVGYGIKYDNGTWIRYNYGTGAIVL